MGDSGPNRGLLSQAQAINDLLISLPVLSLQVLEETGPSTDHLQQSSPRGVVLLVRFQVFRQLLDSAGQQRDLHLRRAGILSV